MHRYYFYQGQFVTAGQLRAGFDDAENADRAMAADWKFKGIVYGGGLTQSVSPGLSAVLEPTVAYDNQGQRIYVSGPVSVDLSQDYLSVSTAVAGSGNKKILSVFLKFKRVNTSPQTTTETPPQTIYYDQAEGYEVLVYQGAEGLSPSPVSIPADTVLLGDVTLSNTAGVSQTQVHTDGVATGGSLGFAGVNVAGHDIAQRGCGDQTVPGNVAAARTQVLFAIAHASTWPGINARDLPAALLAVSQQVDAMTASGVLNYLGSDLTPNETGAWADGTTLPAQLTLGDALSNSVAVLGASAVVSTTIAAGSNNQVLPQATINVASTASFDAAGTFNVVDDLGNVAVVAYTGTSGGNQFTGCTLVAGSGTLLTGQAVTSGTTGAEKVGAQGYTGVDFSLPAGPLQPQVTAIARRTDSLSQRVLVGVYEWFYDNSGLSLAGSSPSFNSSSPTTTIAPASSGAALPQATINVASTAGFPASGSFSVVIAGVGQAVNYTGKTGTTFTGCTGGAGTLAASQGVIGVTSGVYDQWLDDENIPQANYADVPGVQVGDVLVVRLTMRVKINTNAVCWVRLAVTEQAGGASPVFAELEGSRCPLNLSATDASNGFPLATQGTHVSTAAGTSRVRFQGLVKSAGGSLVGSGAFNLHVEHYRQLPLSSSHT